MDASDRIVALLEDIRQAQMEQVDLYKRLVDRQGLLRENAHPAPQRSGWRTLYVSGCTGITVLCAILAFWGIGTMVFGDDLIMGLKISLFFGITAVLIPIVARIVYQKLWTTASAQRQEVLCPDCGYNLRGLHEAKCPECGSGFTLDQLLVNA